MIFQSGHGVKTVKEISLFLNSGLTTAKKSPKKSVIIIKTLQNTEKNSVEMQELPLDTMT